MKKLVFFFIVIFPLSLHAQEEKKIDSKISNVTVFLTKAQVTRKASTRLEGGKVNLILTGLPSVIDQQSLQVSGKGNLIIHGISHRMNYLNEFNKPKSLKVLSDSLEILQRQIAFEKSQLEILSREEQMILSNQKIGGTTQSLTAAELKAMADFYRTRLTDIITSRMKIEEKIAKYNASLEKIRRQYNEQSELYSRNTSEIVISVSSEAATTADLEVSYVVNNAGWYPVYDLRAVNTKSPVQLSYKANVYQSTGEEWKNVRLKLSTANPSLGGLKPELYTWYLNFYEPIVYKSERSYDARKKAMAAPSAVMEREIVAEEVSIADAQTTADYVKTIQTTLNAEFDISIPYTVTSSNKPTLVDIKNHELKSDYKYSVAPKLDSDAFLMAQCTGWEDLNLLPGEANIFFEGTFVSKSYIDPNSIRDTLAISLGRDKRIVVKREKLKDFSSKKLIGTNKREEYAYQITVRNGKAEPVKITVEDHIPVSQNSQIEVTVSDVGGAKYNAVTGKLTWEINLNANESKKLQYKFEIKYPKDKIIAGLD